MIELKDLTDQYLINALTDQDKAKEVIRLFYSHTIDLTSISNGMSLDVLTDAQVCEILIKLLSATSSRQLIDLLSEDFSPFKIEKADICQFSNFDDCYYRVIDLAIRSGIEGISWDKMGFLLRVKPRTKVADQKYGENHGKTAVQMGLCQMDNRHHFWPTALGIYCNRLNKDIREELKSKFCLYIPIIQNYFAGGMDEEMLQSYFSILTESTQKRRRPNINHLIGIVKESLL